MGRSSDRITPWREVRALLLRKWECHSLAPGNTVPLGEGPDPEAPSR